MATARPFAYNTSGTIDGTTQVGDLSVGVPTSGFTNNPQYWNGPDEELGYVIALPISGASQPTPIIVSAPTKLLTLSNFFIGNDISVTNGGQTASQQFGYQQTVLGNAQIDPSSKVMFSVLFNTDSPSTLPGSRVIGIGRTSMNYKSVPPYGAYPGNDNQSMGYCADGTILYNGGVYASGFSTWTDNDVIDIVINNNYSGMWVRVNGGDWNNNPTDNPETNTGGFEIINAPFYPALCPGYQGVITIQNSAEYGVPSGYTLLGSNETASVGFFRSSALTDESFVELVNGVFNQNFTTASDASTWLTNNGYWNSYEGSPSVTPTSTPTGTAEPTPTPTSTPTGTPEGATPTPTGTPTPTPTSGTIPTGFTVNFSEVGSNVVMSASGTLNINDLTFVNSSTFTGPGGLGINSATFIMGGNGNFSSYSGFTTTASNFGSGSSIGASSGSGNVFGVIFDSAPPYQLVVPSGYTTGQSITSTQTFNSQSFSSMGLTPGTYTYTWGSGENADAINVVVGGPSPTPTPTPSSGATTDGWLFYYSEGPISVGPPTSNGNAVFLSNPGTIGVYNPNYTGGTLELYFNQNNSVGTSYLTQFQELDNSGGTLTISQGSNTVIYSGASAQYSLPSNYLVLQVSNTSQMIQSASTPFVSGTTINVVVN